MKSLYFLLVTISLLLLLAYIISYAKKTVTKMDKYLLIMNCTAGGIIFSNMIIAIANSYFVAMLAHIAYFICMDWLVFTLMIVCALYTGIKLKYGVKILRVLLIMDSLNIFLNLFFKHCFELVSYIETDGDVYYRLIQYPIYTIHLVLCYIGVLCAIATMVYKVFKVPMIYGIRYIYFMVSALAVIFIDAVYLVFKLPLDWSVVSYAMLTIGGSYLIRVYVPKKLLVQTESLVANTIDTGIIIFDIDDNCLLINEFVRLFFNQTDEELLAEGGLIRSWLEGHRVEDIDDLENNERTESIIVDGEEKHYSVLVEKNVDKKGLTLGCYILVQDITDVINHSRADHFKATRDELTGIFNRRYFFECTEKLLKKNDYKDYVLVVSDISNFRMLNDIYGNEMADSMLVRFAEFIQNNIHISNAVWGRIGGDDFAVCIPKIYYDETRFIRLGQEIMEDINEGRKLKFKCNMGVFEVTEKMPVSTMCDRAQMAIGKIRQDYSTTLAYYDESLQKNLNAEQEFNLTLADALANEEICIFIQPQVNREGITLGGECLVRWKRKDGSFVNPGEFIPIFEKNGRIVDIDKKVWELTCKKLKEWQSKGREDLYLSINISPIDIILMDVYGVITGLVEKHGVNPALLKLEITESAIMNDVSQSVLLLEKLQSYGFKVEMDDFGSAYSSLNMLKDIPVDVLKVDMAFLQKTINQKKGEIILASIVELAVRLGLEVVVEGVETSEHLRFLSEIGCDCFQGYYFSRPLPVSDFENRVSIVG